jgi:hypothetical protein
MLEPEMLRDSVLRLKEAVQPDWVMTPPDQ